MMPKKFTMVAALAALALVTTITRGRAADYYVDTNNPKTSDANAGTADLPFKTISAAAKIAQPGDTVLIKGGTYPETVVIPSSGEKEKPITFKAVDKERVIITGAEKITGWKKCAKDDAPGNASYDKIYMVDLDWQPERLIESSSKRVIFKLSRLPEEGAWQPTSATGRKVFADPVHLTQTDPKAFAGWTLMAFYEAGGGAAKHTDFTYEPGTHQITLAKDWVEDVNIDVKRDTYWFENSPAGIVKPGEFASQKTDNGWRIWVWPTKIAGDQPVVEGTKRTECIAPDKCSFLVFDRLEICYSAGQGIGTNIKLSDSVIQNCYVHDCKGYGIGLNPGERVTIRRNIFSWCLFNVCFFGGKDNLVEENDMSWAGDDSIDAASGVRNLTIRRNYFHDNFRYGHPEHFQCWDDVQGLTIQDNVMFNGGQGIMTANLRDFKFINNLMIGSYAVCLIVGGDSQLGRKGTEEEQLKQFRDAPPDNIEIIHNTVCATDAMPTGFTGKGYVVRDNVIAPLHSMPLYTVEDASLFKGDYNLLWPNPDNTRSLVVAELLKTVQQDGKEVLKQVRSESGSTLADLQEKFGLEQHGVVADPQFTNAPKFACAIDYRRVSSCTRTKIYTHGKFGDQIAVGDTVEIALDGVPRKVTEVGEDEEQGYFVFTPARDMVPVSPENIVNWGDKKVNWDLHLKETSPGHKKASDGTDMGSSVNLQNYMKGDFNGDGKRLLPDLPKEE
ncbi:MAG: right-handed parallel beta-helix repeat-containing protein [Verrucomicrobiota bacterium]